MDDNKVAVLLEDLRAQFRTFGEGLQLVNDKIDRLDQKLDTHIAENRREFETNRQEHHQLIQMIKELDREYKLKSNG
jgi:hypothetical protein